MKIQNLRKFCVSIRNRPIGVVLGGKSIEELENRIKEFKDKNIYWIGLNSFDIPQEYILSKINQKCNVIYCMARYFPHIEKSVRIPMLWKALKNGSFVISHEWIIDKYFDSIGQNKLFNTYRDNILLTNEIKAKKENLFDILSTFTVNSVGYILTSLSVLGARKIFLFGFDGSLVNSNVSYYKPELQDQRRQPTEEKSKDYTLDDLYHLSSDTEIFDSEFSKYYPLCMEKFNIIEHPLIYNCSINSQMKSFIKLTYNEALERMN